MVNKIKRTKLAPKLMLLAILMITVFTGFACTFAVAKENQSSTTLEFKCTEVLDIWDIQEIWGEGKVEHWRVYKKAFLIDGTIDGIPFDELYLSYDELYLHVKIYLATGKIIAIGKVTMYIKWNGQVGTFYGSVVAKQMAGDEPFEGKYVLQGTGVFEGMKLFGTVLQNPISPWINELSGTILIPN